MPKLTQSAESQNRPRRRRLKRPQSSTTSEAKRADRTPRKKSIRKGKTDKATWKQFERDSARKFGCDKRTPLSGGNSGHTRSDTLHPDLFIEAKYRSSFSVFRVWEQAAKEAFKENKIPLLTLKEKGNPDFLILCHPDDLKEIANYVVE